MYTLNNVGTTRDQHGLLPVGTQVSVLKLVNVHGDFGQLVFEGIIYEVAKIGVKSRSGNGIWKTTGNLF